MSVGAGLGSIFAKRFEEYAVGETQDARSRVITGDDITVFADLSGDQHPAHTDEAFATERFGGRLAHGVLTFAVVVGLTVEYNELSVAYGYDRIRFPRPVLAGDTVTASAEVIGVREHRNPAIGLVTKAYTAVNQRGETVLVCEHVLAVQKRPAAA
ncbi:MAG: hypothetical protein JWR01_2203 [Subtercola sp.]|nr:hypothetical protein [Subtercola sp.]